MSKFSITTTLAHLENKLRRGARRRESQNSMFAFRAPNFEPVKYIIKKPYSPISVLNDDVLLHIFYIHRLHIEDEDDTYGVFWDRQRWWYKLAHVSRRWRDVILAAPSILDLHLLCTSGVPVADMLAHSPTLPLTICYRCGPFNGYTMTAEDVNGTLFALSHRDRVHRIALYMPSSELEKLFVAMDGQFPILERLNIVSLIPGVTLPRTFGAPNLSHGELKRVALSIQCPLFTGTSTGLVSLRLRDIPRSGYFPPSNMLTSLSLMPQLETLWIGFNCPVRSRDVRDTATIVQVTLPNLREFRLWGVRAYLEGLCARITAPVLSVFGVEFFNQLTFAVPRLLSFMQTSENLQFHALKLVCGTHYVCLQGVPQLGTWKYPLKLRILCRHLDWQISSAIQILDALSPVLSVVEQFTLFVNGDESSKWHNEIDRTQWRGLLRSFSNVKVLRARTQGVGGHGLGHALRTEDGEQALELLPNLEEVICNKNDDENAFTPFINEREAVGRPVRIVDDSDHEM
jgi:hypothetical protein